jgi:hypothetical protein
MPDLHDATLKNFALKFGWVAKAKELMEAWRSSTLVARPAWRYPRRDLEMATSGAEPSS